MVMLSRFHLKRVLGVIASIILLLLVVGCASITIKDDLASGIPKGFVKFYYLKSEGNIGYRPAIYSIDSNGEVFEDRTSHWDLTNEIGLQIAKPPGSYHFAVRTGNADKQVQVKIEENRITPVRISFSNVQKTTSYHAQTITFRMNLYVEDSYPVER
jgi:hypothetical protein